jgi:glycine/D-amino acid oxidase-like deaminating enzyme
MARVLIVGGGVIGSAIAYFLLANADFRGEVVVIERDPSYTRASSALSAGSIRQQFSSPVNIAMSQFGIEFLRDLRKTLSVNGDSPEIALRESGYLYLASAEGFASLQRNHAVQIDNGASVALLAVEELQKRFPWLSCDGLAGGSLGLAGEGWFDGYGLLQGFRRKAQSLGAVYRQAEVTSFLRDGSRLTAAKLADGGTVLFDYAVNAGGPWAASVARMADIELPVRARRRCVFAFACKDEIADCPLVIDPCGLWFRPEGSMYICGYPPQVDADDLPLDVDYRLWDDVVWPRLAERVPGFEAIKLHSAWAGYYEFNVFDHNAILGCHDSCSNLYFANGFSGHGLQHSPAVGRGLAELLLYGRYTSLDLSDLGFARVTDNKPIVELNVI